MMIKRFAYLMLMLLTIPSSMVMAADCTFSWKASTGATGYYLEYSKDGGQTWIGKLDTGSLLPDAHGECSFVYPGVPEDGLCLFRVAAVNAVSVAPRLEAGAWYNHLWKPVLSPSGSGIK